MKKILRIAAVVAALICAGVMSCSCDVDYTEEELMKAAGELIEASYEINIIYFGEGLPVSEADSEEAQKFADSLDLDVENVQYLPVTEESAYLSIEEIKEATAAVYSAEYCEYLFEMAFAGLASYDGTSAVFARYMEDEDGTLTQRVGLSENALALNRTYDISAINAEAMSESEATVSVQSFIDGEKDEVLTFTLVREEGGWRLDTPTY